jgi:hypothetical protein
MRQSNKIRTRGGMAVSALTLGLGALSLGGCSSKSWNQTGDDFGGPDRKGFVPVTKAHMPAVVQPYPRIEEALQCIRHSGVLKGRTFVVGPFADSTGKINAVAPGSTGNFLPQGGSAAYITDAIRKAGGGVVSTYFGSPTRAVPAHYAINGIFNTLDFGNPVQADVRIGGVGPTAGLGWAQLSLSIQLDEVGSRLNRQMSMIQRPVRYSQIGVGAGRDLGGNLVSGNVALQNQERLQLESLNGPIGLGVVDVIFKEFHHAKEECGRIVADLLSTSGHEHAHHEHGKHEGPMKSGAGRTGWATTVEVAEKK